MITILFWVLVLSIWFQFIQQIELFKTERICFTVLNFEFFQEKVTIMTVAMPVEKGVIWFVVILVQLRFIWLAIAHLWLKKIFRLEIGFVWGIFNKMNSLYQTCSKIMRGTRVQKMKILIKYRVSRQLVLNFDFNSWFFWLSYQKNIICNKNPNGLT